tara:strand:+ start:1823 stop:1969 length:147 start_codon:yes stop_codon:yes gene_type:complete
MITVTYDYTGHNSYSTNYTKSFDTKEMFKEWLANGKKPYIYHVISHKQ